MIKDLTLARWPLLPTVNALRALLLYKNSVGIIIPDKIAMKLKARTYDYAMNRK